MISSCRSRIVSVEDTREQLRGEGADALHARHQALGLQLAQRAVHRHAADAELRATSSASDGIRAPGGQRPRPARLQVLLDARVGRRGGAGGASGRRNHRAIYLPRLV